MTINGHFLMLVVATGLFVRLWGANDRHRPAAVSRTPSRPVSTTPPPQNVSLDCNGDVPAYAASNASPVGDSQEEIWTADTCPIPLPSAIGAGVYRVVDDTGRIARLELTVRTAKPLVGDAPAAADIQTLTVDSRRWYFIRLQTTVAVAPLECEEEILTSDTEAGVEAEPVRTALANRKFDFTGFDGVPELDAAKSSEFRPESPALPVSE